MSWDERYSRGDHADLAPLPFLVDLSRRLGAGNAGPRGRVLDLACGAGRHSVLFAEQGWEVTAVDSSAVALGLVRARDERIRTVQGNLEGEGFTISPGSWDVAIVTFYLQRSLFARLRETAAPGARVAVAIPMVDSRGGVRPMNPDYLVQGSEDLAREFAGWIVEANGEEWRDPPARRYAWIVALRE